jgi:sugar transferase EpsL
MMIIAIMVRMKIGSPVLFRQVRPGLRGRPFVIYKFRTMTDNRDEKGKLLPDGERLTRLGRLLRKTSMDGPQITPVRSSGPTGQAQITAD